MQYGLWYLFTFALFKWGFQEEHIEAVKDALFLSDTPLGTLYGNTGTGSEAFAVAMDIPEQILL